MPQNTIYKRKPIYQLRMELIESGVPNTLAMWLSYHEIVEMVNLRGGTIWY